MKPDAAVTLGLPWQADGRRGAAIRLRIIVESEWFYDEKVFPTVLGELEEGPVRDLIKQAKSIAEARRFVLFEAILRRPS